MTYRLRFQNNYGEKFYFCALGEPWDSGPIKRLIARTSPEITDSTTFASPADAQQVLVEAGMPAGWRILDETGQVTSGL